MLPQPRSVWYLHIALVVFSVELRGMGNILLLDVACGEIGAQLFVECRRVGDELEERAMGRLSVMVEFRRVRYVQKSDESAVG